MKDDKMLALRDVRKIRNKDFEIASLTHKEATYLINNALIAMFAIIITVTVSNIIGMSVPGDLFLYVLTVPVMGATVFSYYLLKFLKKHYGKDSVFFILHEFSILETVSPGLKNKIQKEKMHVMPYGDYKRGV
jgi:hypothetical protein